MSSRHASFVLLEKRFAPVLEVVHNEYTYGSMQGKKISDEDQWMWIIGGWKAPMGGDDVEKGVFFTHKNRKTWIHSGTVLYYQRVTVALFRAKQDDLGNSGRETDRGIYRYSGFKPRIARPTNLIFDSSQGE